MNLKIIERAELRYDEFEYFDSKPGCNQIVHREYCV